jgi:hypothetical protein
LRRLHTNDVHFFENIYTKQGGCFSYLFTDEVCDCAVPPVAIALVVVVVTVNDFRAVGTTLALSAALLRRTDKDNIIIIVIWSFFYL